MFRVGSNMQTAPGARLSIVVKNNAMRNMDSSAVLNNNNVKRYKDIPGPRSLPFIGPIFSFLPGGNLAGLKGVKLAERIYKEYGKIARIGGLAGYYDTVWLFDMNAIEHIYRSENLRPQRLGFPSLDYYRQRHNKTYDPQRMAGLVTDQGETWWSFRSAVNQPMLKPETVKLYDQVLAEVAREMIPRIRWMREEENRIKKHFYDEITLWALESIGVVALGTRLNCLDRNLPEDSLAKKLIQSVHDHFAVIDKLDTGMALWRFISTPTFKKAMQVFEDQDRMTKIYVDEAMKKMQESNLSKDSAHQAEKPVLEKLLEINVHVAHIMASDMLIAGVDTISNTVIATLYLLAKNPEKQDELRKEIERESEKEIERKSDENSQPYLKACMKEAMRMMPAVYANTRFTTKEYNLLGYKIPKNVIVLFPHEFLSNLEEHYPMPELFLPERWLVGKDDPLYHGNAHRFVTKPFGFGTRVCIGSRIAELEIKTIITEMIKNFEVGWEGEPLKIYSTVLNYVTEPFNFIFKDINKP